MQAENVSTIRKGVGSKLSELDEQLRMLRLVKNVCMNYFIRYKEDLELIKMLVELDKYLIQKIDDIEKEIIEIKNLI